MAAFILSLGSPSGEKLLHKKHRKKLYEASISETTVVLDALKIFELDLSFDPYCTLTWTGARLTDLRNELERARSKRKEEITATIKRKLAQTNLEPWMAPIIHDAEVKDELFTISSRVLYLIDQAAQHKGTVIYDGD